VIHLDDQASVREQYASEDNLRARQALWVGATGTDPKDVLWRTLCEWQPKRVLEVGGGQGELSERIQRELGAEVSFLDLSPRMVELARARGIDAREGDVQALPFADRSFDTVTAAWMLYHVPDVDRALAEIARVLVPGGALIAVTVSVDHIAELRELFGHGTNLSHTFSRENAESLLRPHFAAVERYDADVEARVASRDTLVAYRDSLAVPVTREVPDDLPLPFVVHGRTSIFFATT
jgi:SAM-dependent methyltransferase